jgi:hypothetical protein
VELGEVGTDVSLFVCLSVCRLVLFVARSRTLSREPRLLRPIGVAGRGATAEERASLSKFAEKSVTKKTLAGGEAAWARWVEYLEGLPAHRRPCPFMDELKLDEDKRERLSLFTMWLYEQKGYNREQVVQEIGKVKRFFEITMRDTGFFKSAIQARVLESTRANTEEKKEILQQKSVDKSLPLCAELALIIREEYWEKCLEDWSCKSMDRRVLWIALALSYNNGPRVSNVTLRDGPTAEDHCVRARDLTFYFQEGSGIVIVPVFGGEHLRRYVGGDNSKIRRNLLSCSFSYLTTKAGTTSHELARRSVHEGMVLEDLCTWVLKSGVKMGDELVTRYPSGQYAGDKGCRRAVLTQKKYAMGLAWLGVRVELEGLFTTRFARIGFVVNGACDALCEVEIAEGGGWSTESRVPLNHYLPKHPLVREKVNSARDARARRGNLSVPLDAWARCGANGVSSLTLADVRVMAWDAELLRQSLTESVDNSS